MFYSNSIREITMTGKEERLSYVIEFIFLSILSRQCYYDEIKYTIETRISLNSLYTSFYTGSRKSTSLFLYSLISKKSVLSLQKFCNDFLKLKQ